MTDGSSEQQPSQPGPPPYGQPPYGPPPTQPYPQGGGAPPPYGQPYGRQAPYGYHQNPSYGYPGQPQDGGAQAAMIVGIVSLAVGMIACGLGFLGSPVAWYLGHQAKKRIDASGGQLAGRGNAQAGFVLGIIGTVLLALLIVAVVVVLVILLGAGLSLEDNGSGPGVAT